VLWKLAGVLDQWLEWREKRRGRKHLERAAIARRADQQHAWVLAGDERGTYGDYPPAMSASKILASVAVTVETGPNTQTHDCRAHRRSIPRANALHSNLLSDRRRGPKSEADRAG
jgi:hypothetical protein